VTREYQGARTGLRLRRIAHKFRTRNDWGPLSIRSQTKPRGVRREAMISRQPPSSGLTEGREISSSAS
jgi:hypothetical protein